MTIAPTSPIGGSRLLRKSGADGSRRLRHLVQAAVPLLLLLLWILLSVRMDLVPGVVQTMRALASSLRSGEISQDSWSTLSSVVAGFAIAVAVGVPLGFALGRSSYWLKVFEPIVAAGYAVPRILLYPIMLAIFGFGIESKVAIAFLSAVFPILVSTIAGARSVSLILVKLARSMGMSHLQRFAKVLLPAAIPAVAAGLRMGLGSSFITVVVAEMSGAPEGLGVVVKKDYGSQQLPEMFSVILLIVVIALAGNLLLGLVERRSRRHLS